MNEFEQGQIIAEIILAEKERALSEEEKLQLQQWLKQHPGNYQLYEKLKYNENLFANISELDNFNTKIAFAGFENRINKSKIRKINRVLIRIAAVFFFVIAASYLILQQTASNKLEVQHQQTIIHPGSSKAILKLADGTTVDLEKETADITESDGTTIHTDDNKIVYKPSDKGVREREIKYNTIDIPRGGEYQLTLSDGTNVWLNSETSIRYPVVFAKSKREIFIEGEAYFDVAHNAEIPFIVNTSKMKIDVLGTAFNIRAYNDEEAAATTLVRGKVNVTSTQTKQSFVLKPNEQFRADKENTSVRKVNVNQYIAWKEGRIFFENNTLCEIFSEVARWYNVNVEYESEALKELRFSVDVKRYDQINEITDMIELTKKVKFELNNNTVKILEQD